MHEEYNEDSSDDTKFTIDPAVNRQTRKPRIGDHITGGSMGATQPSYVQHQQHKFSKLNPTGAIRWLRVSHTVAAGVHLWSLGVLTAAGCGIGSVHEVVRSNLLVDPSKVEEGEMLPTAYTNPPKLIANTLLPLMQFTGYNPAQSSNLLSISKLIWPTRSHQSWSWVNIKIHQQTSKLEPDHTGPIRTKSVQLSSTSQMS
ncbi:hypothetical protein F511_16762 [Dorcoceras hygrometricum]|uniref:Uncharacterized protein n=1 Tax=Dorcoceras hygrometricum TaxID=472368 RepID=A0A2Z7BP84_9LAMI|nr:hypothetical protein F511_16762 [Dorcoceras hygrometricum]